MSDPLVHAVAALSLALLFLAAARGKWRDFATFRAALEAYAVVPAPLLGVVAVAVPVLEVAIGLALLVPVAKPWNAIAAAAVLLLYAGAIGVNLARGRNDIDCGCFGDGRHGLSSWMIPRNVVLAALALPLLVPVVPRELGLFDGVVVLAGVAAAALLYRASEQLIANRIALDAWLNGDA